MNSIRPLHPNSNITIPPRVAPQVILQLGLHRAVLHGAPRPRGMRTLAARVRIRRELEVEVTLSSHSHQHLRFLWRTRCVQGWKHSPYYCMHIWPPVNCPPSALRVSRQRECDKHVLPLPLHAAGLCSLLCDPCCCRDGWTALFDAAAGGFESIARLLFDFGVDDEIRCK